MLSGGNAVKIPRWELFLKASVKKRMEGGEIRLRVADKGAKREGSMGRKDDEGGGGRGRTGQV